MAGPNDILRPNRPTLAWIVILIVIGLVVWMFFAFAGTNRAVSQNPPAPAGVAPPVNPAGAEDTPVADVAAVLGAHDRRKLAGQAVQFTNVALQQVIDPHAFWVSQGENRILVETEQPTNVRAGQTVSISGVIEPAPPDAAHRLGINAKEASALQAEGIYVRGTTR